MNRKQTHTISASVLSCNILELGDDIKRLEDAGADILHFDIMDGHYVDNFTFGLHTIEAVKKRSRLPVEVHLEICNANRHIQSFANAGADTIIIHADTVFNPIRVLNSIRKLGVKSGFAINPAESIDMALELADYIDFLLVMSVEPGFGGQAFHGKSSEKLNQLSRLVPENIVIGIDGSVKTDNLEELLRQGAQEIIIGSGLFEGSTVEYNMAKLKETIAAHQNAEYLRNA